MLLRFDAYSHQIWWTFQNNNVVGTNRTLMEDVIGKKRMENGKGKEKVDEFKKK